MADPNRIREAETRVRMAIELYGDIRQLDPLARISIATMLLSFCLRTHSTSEAEYRELSVRALEGLLAAPSKLPSGVGS